MRRAARYLAISSKKSMCALKKNERRGAKSSTASPAASAASTYAKPVADRERELLRGGRAGLADVVAGDRDGVPARHLGRAEADHVAHQAHARARAGNTNSFWAWYSFRMSFCSVPPSRARVDPDLLRGGDVHRQEHGGGRVDRHRRGDRPEVDVAVEVLDVREGVDRDTALPHLADRERVVRVAPHQGREVERGREPVAPGREQVLEASVRVHRRPEPGEHAHRPELGAVHVGVRAAGEGVLAGPLGAVRPVDRVDLDPRVRGEVPLRHGRHCRTEHAAARQRLAGAARSAQTGCCGAQAGAGTKCGGRSDHQARPIMSAMPCWWPAV